MWTVNFFEICSGVRQGYVLSPLLFSLVMDWVMKKSSHETARIEWMDGSKLGFKLLGEGKMIGLDINVAQTKIGRTSKRT